jgi:hypothetical protein
LRHFRSKKGEEGKVCLMQVPPSKKMSPLESVAAQLDALGANDEPWYELSASGAFNALDDALDDAILIHSCAIPLCVTS